MLFKESKGKRPQLPAPVTPLLIGWDTVVLNVPGNKKSITVWQAQQSIRKVMSNEKNGYIAS